MSALKVEQPGEREFSVTPIGRVKLVEVTEGEMSQLETAATAGQTSMGMFLFVLGALLSTLVSWVGVQDPTPVQVGIYVGASIALSGLAVAFAIFWRRDAKTRSDVFKEIRARIESAKGQAQ